MSEDRLKEMEARIARIRDQGYAAAVDDRDDAL